MWHVSSRSGAASRELLYSVYFIFFYFYAAKCLYTTSQSWKQLRTAGVRFVGHVAAVVVEVAVPRRVDALTVGTRELSRRAHRRV